MRAISWSSIPTMEISPGTSRPDRRSAQRAPIAISSYSAKYRSRHDGAGQQFCHRGGTSLQTVRSGRHEAFVEGEAGGMHRLLVPAASSGGGDEIEAGIVRRTGDEPDPFVPEMHQVVDGATRGGALVDPDGRRSRDRCADTDHGQVERAEGQGVFLGERHGQGEDAFHPWVERHPLEEVVTDIGIAKVVEHCVVTVQTEEIDRSSGDGAEEPARDEGDDDRHRVP